MKTCDDDEAIGKYVAARRKKEREEEKLTMTMIIRPCVNTKKEENRERKREAL